MADSTSKTDDEQNTRVEGNISDIPINEDIDLVSDIPVEDTE